MRELLWVDDMASACLFLLEHVNADVSEAEVRNTHINIGTGNDISIADLAELIKKVVGYTGDFVFNANKPDGTMKKLTDVSKINAMGWKAQVELEEGLQKMYHWYQS
jgi:GDP-L-fucose synthase